MTLYFLYGSPAASQKASGSARPLYWFFKFLSNPQFNWLGQSFVFMEGSNYSFAGSRIRIFNDSYLLELFLPTHPLFLCSIWMVPKWNSGVKAKSWSKNWPNWATMWVFASLGTLTSALSVLLIVLGDGRCVLSGHIELSALFLFGPKEKKQQYFLQLGLGVRTCWKDFDLFLPKDPMVLLWRQ